MSEFKHDDAPEAYANDDGKRSRHPVFDCDMPSEDGGPSGPEPTRFGDWEVKGRCSDF